MNKKLLPWLITFCALGLGGTAAYYSIIGLSKLFTGTSTAVIIMASFLELSKLTLATLLHSYWDQLNKLLKIYLTTAAFVLVLITSAGIYGYLSNAYQKSSDQTSIIESKILSLETKKKLFEETRDNILKEKQSIATLQGTLSQASTTQFTDKNGNLIVRSNNAAIRNIESASKSNEILSAKIDIVNDSIFAIESKILEIKTTAVGESELGPLKYLSALTGVTMDRIINWYILVIIFVFDPLAISLVIAANFAFARLNKREETSIEEEIIDIPEKDWIEDWPNDNDEELEKASLQDLQDWYDEEENTLEPDNDLKQTTKEYEIYKEQDQKIQNNGWVIEDEEKSYDTLMQSLDNINNINNENSDFFNKKAKIDAEIARIKEYERSLQEKRKNKNNEDDDTIIY
jgi:hypothetical protein